MNIDIVIPKLETGGAEVSASKVYKILSHNFPGVRLVELDALTKKKCDSKLVNKSRFLRVLLKLYTIRNSIKENETRIVICFMEHISIQYFLALIGYPIKIISCERSNPFFKDKSIFGKILTKIVYRNSELVIVQTKRLQEKLQDLWGLNNVQVIPNVKPYVMNKIKVSKQATKIVAVSRIIATKNLKTLILAGTNYLKDDCQLLIYGDGPEKHKIENIISTLDLSEKVKIISGITDKDRIFSDADIFVSLSTVEGMSNSLLEAASFGIPCIAYDCDYGAREILDNGSAGILLQTLDTAEVSKSVNLLKNDVKLRQLYSNKAYAHTMNNFNSDLISALWCRIVEQIQ